MASSKGSISRICLHCGNPFSTFISEIKRGSGRYCTPLCYHTAQIGAQRGTLEERFWNKVDKRGPDECWPWIAHVGYRKGVPMSAKFRVDRMHKKVEASRVSWLIHNGPIPKGLWVLHHCDFRICVNPKHLFLGTNADNMTDMASKDRQVHKITNAQAREIFESAKTEYQDVVAARYGISSQLVSGIVRGKTRKHLYLTQTRHIV